MSNPHQPGKVFVADTKEKTKKMLRDKTKYMANSDKFGTRKQAYKAGWKDGYAAASPLPASSPDPFIEKHLAIIKQKTKDALIDQHIGKMWGDLSSASIKYFLETGTINGGFREHLINLMDAWKKYKLDEPASSQTEFQYKENIKIVVDFVVDETILIEGWGYKLNGEHTIKAFKPNFGGSESGIMVMISGYDSWIDVGWLTKIKKPNNSPLPAASAPIENKEDEKLK